MKLSGPSQRQQGSLAVVVAIIAVVVLISVALISRVQGDFQNVNTETNIEQARSLAQSGLADALFQIDQQGTNPQSFCNAPAADTSPPGSSCQLDGIPGAPGAVYTARYDSSNGTYTVWSRGTAKSARYAFKATVTDDIAVNAALYGNQIDLSGIQDMGVVDAQGATVSRPVPIGIGGSNGESTASLKCSNYTNISLFDYTGGTASIQKHCGTPTELSGSSYPQTPVDHCSASAPATPCLPSAPSRLCATMSCTVTGQILSGTYVVYGDVTFSGNVSTTGTGPVQIFVFPPKTGTDTNPPVTFKAATVNSGGDPANLQIYVGEGGDLSVVGTNTVSAVYWGPATTLVLHGKSHDTTLDWTGALILDTIQADGNPSFDLTYDESLQNQPLQANWRTGRVLQTPADFTIPHDGGS